MDFLKAFPSLQTLKVQYCHLTCTFNNNVDDDDINVMLTLVWGLWGCDTDICDIEHVLLEVCLSTMNRNCTSDVRKLTMNGDYENGQLDNSERHPLPNFVTYALNVTVICCHRAHYDYVMEKDCWTHHMLCHVLDCACAPNWWRLSKKIDNLGTSLRKLR